jgi:hypothetical protein
MKDMQAQLGKLRKDAAECALIRSGDGSKEARTRLADHLSVLAAEVERAVAENVKSKG